MTPEYYTDPEGLTVELIINYRQAHQLLDMLEKCYDRAADRIPGYFDTDSPGFEIKDMQKTLYDLGCELKMYIAAEKYDDGQFDPVLNRIRKAGDGGLGIGISADAALDLMRLLHEKAKGEFDEWIDAMELREYYQTANA